MGFNGKNNVIDDNIQAINGDYMGFNDKNNAIDDNMQAIDGDYMGFNVDFTGFD